MQTGTYVFVRRQTEVIAFDSSGQLTAISDLNHHTIGVTPIPPLAQIRLTESSPASRTVTMSFDGHHVTGLTDPIGRTVTYIYDAAGNLSTVIDINGGHWVFTYDTAHRMLTMEAPKYFGDTTTSPSPVVSNSYDSEGRVDHQTDEIGRTTYFDYAPAGAPAGSTKITDPKGNADLQTYTNGLLADATKGYGSSEAASWHYDYDPTVLGVTKVTDPNGHHWMATYDTRGNQLTTSDDVHPVTTNTYNSFNEPASMTDAKGIRTDFAYDPNPLNGTPGYNLLTRSTTFIDADGVSSTQTTTNHYPESGNATAGDVTSVTDPNLKAWTFGYDTNGDLNRLTAPATPENAAGNATTMVYDAGGRKTSEISPKGNVAGVPDPDAFKTTFTYDADNRLRTTTDPLGHMTAHHYDLNRNEDSTTDADTNVTSFTYDPANELLVTSRPDHATTLQNSYFADGTLATQTDGASQPTGYAYDHQGRLTTVTDPLGRPTGYSYDPAGNLLTKVDPSGICVGTKVGCTTTTYDAANQLKTVDYSDAATPDVTNVTYDADGQRTGMTEVVAGVPKTSTWVWDPLHRLVSSTDVAGSTTAYRYDLRNTLTKLTYPGGLVVNRHPDAAGRVDSVQAVGQPAVTFAYDPNSGMTNETFSPTTVTDTRSFDNADRLMGISENRPGSATTFTYGRDSANQLTSVATSGAPTPPAGDNHSFSYNPLNQLKTDNASTFGYDAADNLTRTANGTAQTFDVANELTSSTGSSAATSYGLAADVPTPADFDGDGKADVAVFRPSVGAWYIHPSGGGSDITVYLGLSSDVPAPGDFDGDGKADEAVFRPSTGAWYIHPSGGGSDTTVYFGLNGDIPVAADYNGDGKADVAVFRPSVGAWYIHPSGGGSDTTVYFGLNGDTPMSGDYNGDGKADEVVFRPSVGAWYIHPSGGGSDTTVYFGLNGDTPVAADYDGDHKTDEAVFRPSSGVWYVHPSGGGADTTTTYGTSADTLRPRDYDGDGRADLAFFRPSTSTWNVRATTATTYNYDNRGNRILKAPLDVAPSAYGYDQASRLTSAPGSSYSYNASGLRMTKTTSAVTTKFAWDPAQGLPLLLQEVTPTLTTNYVYGPDGLPVQQIDSTGKVLYYHHDQLGSTRTLTAADGSVAASFNFDAYGRPSATSGTATTPFGYAGQYTDAETGFQYLRTRYYDPTTAQFLVRDPITALTEEPYGYVAGNPLNNVDPSGLWNYRHDYDLGETGTTPQQAMSFLASNFGTVFPVDGAEPKLFLGEHMDLSWSIIPGPVLVTQMSDTGWKFSTELGHGDFPGFVTFNFSQDSDCHLHLTIHGNINGLGNLANPWISPLLYWFYTRGASALWHTLVARLRLGLHIGSGGGGGGGGSW